MNDRLSASERRRKEIESWWALVARILAFILGSVILVSQTFFESQDRLLLIAVGAGLMGPMAAAGVAQVIQAMRGHGPNRE